MPFCRVTRFPINWEGPAGSLTFPTGIEAEELQQEAAKFEYMNYQDEGKENEYAAAADYESMEMDQVDQQHPRMVVEGDL